MKKPLKMNERQFLPGAKLHEITTEAVNTLLGDGSAEKFDSVAFGRLMAMVDYSIERYILEKGYDHTMVKAFFVRSRKGVEFITFWTYELTDYKHLANQMKILMQLDEDDEIESISRIAAGTMKKLPTGNNVYQCDQVLAHGIARMEWDENFEEWLAKMYPKEATDEEVSS